MDVHAHDYSVECSERIGRTELLIEGAGPLCGQPVGERVALMDRFGIDVQVSSVARAQPYLPGASDSADAARLGNELFVQLCRERPGKPGKQT